MICIYIGVRAGMEEGLTIAPLFADGSIALEQFGIAFTVEDSHIRKLQNIGEKDLKIHVPEYEERFILEAGSEREWNYLQ